MNGLNRAIDHLALLHSYDCFFLQLVSNAKTALHPANFNVQRQRASTYQYIKYGPNWWPIGPGITSQSQWRTGDEECAIAVTFRLFGFGCIHTLAPEFQSHTIITRRWRCWCLICKNHLVYYVTCRGFILGSDGVQRAWYGAVTASVQADLIARTDSQTDRARLLAACSEHAEEWLHTAPITV